MERHNQSMTGLEASRYDLLEPISRHGGYMVLRRKYVIHSMRDKKFIVKSVPAFVLYGEFSSYKLAKQHAEMLAQ